MTPVERIIIRFYAANTFMFNHEDDRFYLSEEKKNLLSEIKAALMAEQSVDFSEEQIKNKYKYLRDTFIKADKLVEAKQDLTYLQKCVYQRMYFLKPFICQEKQNNESKAGKYEALSNMKTKQSASEACYAEMQGYLNNTRQIKVNESINILNEIIMSYKNSRVQRLRLHVTLKAIRLFKEKLSV